MTFYPFPLRALSAVALAAALTACNTAPPAPTAAQTKVEIPAAYQDAAAAQAHWKTAEPAEAQARGEWWRAFHDDQLDALQQQAEAGNPGLAAAAARVKAAQIGRAHV